MKPMTLAFFQAGEDLPLFTGSPVMVAERPMQAPKAEPITDTQTMPGWCIRCTLPLEPPRIAWTDDGPLCHRCAGG